MVTTALENETDCSESILSRESGEGCETTSTWGAGHRSRFSGSMTGPWYRNEGISGEGGPSDEEALDTLSESSSAGGYKDSEAGVAARRLPPL